MATTRTPLRADDERLLPHTSTAGSYALLREFDRRRAAGPYETVSPFHATAIKRQLSPVCAHQQSPSSICLRHARPLVLSMSDANFDQRAQTCLARTFAGDLDRECRPSATLDRAAACPTQSARTELLQAVPARAPFVEQGCGAKLNVVEHRVPFFRAHLTLRSRKCRRLSTSARNSTYPENATTAESEPRPRRRRLRALELFADAFYGERTMLDVLTHRPYAACHVTL